MQHKILTATLCMLALCAAVPAYALGASADVSVQARVGSSSVQAALETRITTAISRADQEIERRTAALTDANTKVQAMVRVSDTEKSAVATEVQNEIGALTSLKSKIEADADIDSLKTDIKSITSDYRIFLLVIPQSRIEVAADKSLTVANSMMTLSGKFTSRISDAQTSGKDVTTLSASLADMNAKLGDAEAQANAAVSLVADLQPDQGDASVAASNAAALKTGRADIQSAMQDLKAARQDAGSIVKGLEALGPDTSSSTQTDTSVQTQ